jgi:hypothetical protein
MLEARETILDEQHRGRVDGAQRRRPGSAGPAPRGGRRALARARARQRREQREPRFVDARDRRHEPGQRPLEGTESDDRPALAHDPGRVAELVPGERAGAGPQLEREQAVERDIGGQRQPLEPLGLMGEMPEEFAPGAAAAQRPRDDRPQARPSGAPRRKPGARHRRADDLAQRLALRLPHVPGMASTDDRGRVEGGSGHVRLGFAQRIGSRWIWRTSFRDPMR